MKVFVIVCLKCGASAVLGDGEEDDPLPMDSKVYFHHLGDMDPCDKEITCSVCGNKW